MKSSRISVQFISIGQKNTMCLYIFLILTAYAVVNDAYKITRETAPVPVLQNTELEYKGPVFVIKETDDATEPFVGLIVDGGIERVRPNPRPISVPYPNINLPVNQTLPQIEEDPEYFAVPVRPETVARTQISRTKTITIPLYVLLASVSAQMPWLMVLKKQNHLEYFKTSITAPLSPVLVPQRRRYKRSANVKHGRFYTPDKKYDMIYSEDDKVMLQDICTTVVKELIFLNDMLRQSANNIHDQFDTPQFDDKVQKNDTRIENAPDYEYAVGTEYKIARKTA